MTFKLPINRANLLIWTRAESFSLKYQLGLNIREIMPIECLFMKTAIPMRIFDVTLPQIREILDDINVYKISKMMALAFQ